MRLIFDIKTSREDTLADGKLRTPFPEVGLQLAAYRHAELAAVWRSRQVDVSRRRYYLLNQAERDMAVPVPVVDGGVALLLTPTRYALHPIRCDESVFESFLHLVDVAHHQFEVAPHVVGTPLVPASAWAPAPDDDPFAGLPTEEKA